MDGLQGVAAALQLAEFAFRLYQTLSKFVARAKDADGEALELCETIRRSLNTLKTAGKTLQAREKDLGQGTPAQEEQRIWRNIRESLASWNRNIKRFRKHIEKIPNLGQRQASLNWIDKALLQLKLDRKAPIIERFQRNIAEHVQELNLLLQCLNL